MEGQRYLSEQIEDLHVDRYTFGLKTRKTIFGELSSLEYTVTLLNCEQPSIKELTAIQDKLVLKNEEFPLVGKSQEELESLRQKLIENIRSQPGQYLENLMK